MAASSTIKLANTMEWARRFTFGRRSALGNYLEPALTSANTVMQAMIGPPFAWRWNRVSTGWNCAVGVQDYTLGNWPASTAVSLGLLIVDTNGNSQQVTTAGTTGSSAPTWATVITNTTADGTGTVWTNRGPVLGGSPSSAYSFGWIENASIQDVTTSKWKEASVKISLALDSSQQRPQWVAAQKDDGQNNITFRLMGAPDKAYPVSLNIQKKAALFTSANQTWAPIPDEYSYIYNWGFLALMWLFADDARFPIANQKFVAHLLGANQGLDQTQLNIFLNNWQSITGEPMSNANKLAQGIQARGV